jgi:mannosyltransferase
VVTGGQIALLVPAGDATALATALETLMRDPAGTASMGARAREYVAAHFSIEAEAAKIAAVYERVLGRKTTAGAAA